MGVLLSMAPLWFSSYILQLRVPTVSLTMENIADFISAYIFGNLLQMAFRFWAFRRGCSPTSSPATPTRPWNPPLPRAASPKSFEDVLESGFEDGNVTLLRAWRNRANRFAQLGDSSEPRVSKTS